MQLSTRNRLCCIFLSLIASVAIANDSSTLHGRVTAVLDAVMEHHIEPPTRQQMILHGARRAYAIAKVDVPANISQTISSLSTQASLSEFLTQIESELGDRLPDFSRQFVAGMLQAVPGGGLLRPGEEVRVQGQVAANRYVGIGIALRMKDGTPTIERLFYHGPGRRAGVQQFDEILSIDGVSTDGLKLKQVVTALRGEEGSVVTLSLRQPNEQPRTVEVERGVTFIPTIEGDRQVSPGEWEFTIKSAPRIGLLRIKQIGPSTVHELKKIEAQLRDAKLRGLILDLREGGGILHDTVLLADQLLDGGAIGCAKGRHDSTEHEARPGCLFGDLPIAVLMASFANADRVYLAAALQDHKRAIVVGEPNESPVFIRSHVPLPNDDQLLLATGRLERSDGTTLTKFARNWNQMVVAKNDSEKPLPRKPPFVMPDHVVRYPLGNEERNTDNPFLRKAIDVLMDAAEKDEDESTSNVISG